MVPEGDEHEVEGTEQVPLVLPKAQTKGTEGHPSEKCQKGQGQWQVGGAKCWKEKGGESDR